MNFELEQKHKMIQDVCRKFADAEIEPIAAETDESGEFPKQTVKRLGELGILGISIPKQYGGAGAGYTGFSVAIEEIAKSCAATATVMVAHTSLCASVLVNAGTEEQKQKYLVPLAKGEKLGAFGLTEPNAGSDAANQQTVAELIGDEYIINGSKIFITNGGYADIYVVSAMTDQSAGLRGISVFIVEADREGFSIGTKENKMGIRGSSTTELVFKDVRIPKENLVGKEGAGFKLMMQSLDAGRMVVASQAVGIAQAAYEEALQYSKDRIQFGRPIAKQQIISYMLADMATQIECGRSLVRRAAWGKDNDKDYATHSAMAKLYCSELATKVSHDAIQVHGGYGFIKDYKVERLYRDARITEIYEGTSEIQRQVIASKILK